MLEIKENINVLLSDFPDSEAKTSIILLSNYIIEREK
jgi:hypothetical protein